MMKKIFKFLASSTLLFHFLMAIVMFTLTIVISLKWLEHYTFHNKTITVPNIRNLNTKEAEKLLSLNSLQLVVFDTVTYFNEQQRAASIVRQNPPPGKVVKPNRKIYVYLNRLNHRKVHIPKIIQETQRVAVRKLHAAGLKIEKVSSIEEIGRNMVYEIKYEGKTIDEGTSIERTAELELVVGTGAR